MLNSESVPLTSQGQAEELENFCEDGRRDESNSPASTFPRWRALLVSGALLGCVLGAIAYSKRSTGVSSDLNNDVASKFGNDYYDNFPGTRKCLNLPSNWTDANGETCGDYALLNWCTLYGQHGAGWKSDWGPMSHYAVGGKDARHVCCACGGGSNPVTPPTAKKCGHGYHYTHDGWWANYPLLVKPFGRVKEARFLSSDQCAAECSATYGCQGYSLISGVCWVYNGLGHPVEHASGVACVSEHGQAATTTQPPPPPPPVNPVQPCLTTACRYPYQVMTCPVKAAETTEHMDCLTYEQIADSVMTVFKGLPECTPGSYGSATEYSCLKSEYAGCILGLATYDYMDTWDANQVSGGGADGCVDLAQNPQSNFKKCLASANPDTEYEPLHTLYQSVCGKVSLADFLVIAAQAIMTATRDLQLDDAKFTIVPRVKNGQYTLNKLPKPYGNNLPDEAYSNRGIDWMYGFQYGRKTAKTCEQSPVPVTQLGKNYPVWYNPEAGCTGVNSNDELMKRMQITNKADFVALMGLKNIGFHPTTEPYPGWYTLWDRSYRFSNGYFVSLLMKAYIPSQTSQPSKYEWQRKDDFLVTMFHERMLDNDVCLVHDYKAALEVPKSNPNEHEFFSCCIWWQDNSSALCGNNDHSQGQCCDGKRFAGGQACEAAVEKSTWPNKKDKCQKYFTCGGKSSLNGWAVDEVKKYAFNEKYWLTDLVKVWRHVSHLHQSHLKPLVSPTNDFCDDGQPRNLKFRPQKYVR